MLLRAKEMVTNHVPRPCLRSFWHKLYIYIYNDPWYSIWIWLLCRKTIFFYLDWVFWLSLGSLSPWPECFSIHLRREWHAKSISTLNLVYYKVLNVSHRRLTVVFSFHHVTHTTMGSGHKCCLVYAVWYRATVAYYEVTTPPLLLPRLDTPMCFTLLFNFFCNVLVKRYCKLSSCFLRQLFNRVICF